MPPSPPSRIHNVKVATRQTSPAGFSEEAANDNVPGPARDIAGQFNEANFSNSPYEYGAKGASDIFPEEGGSRRSFESTQSGTRSEKNMFSQGTFKKTKRNMRALAAYTENIKRVFANAGEELSDEDATLIIPNKTEVPSFPYFIFICAVIKDILDILLTLSIVGGIFPFILSLVIAIIILFWGFGKGRIGWLKKKIVRWLLTRFVIMFIVELTPGLNLLPANTVFILMKHYRETKLIRLFNSALDEIEELHKAGRFALD